ncbi:DUF371 domain-containing protein [Candidatus Woesearchaeota archaeon]|nr:DUF371 domain-containing protein [Candidatus Woesearchaeota archaeon]
MHRFSITGHPNIRAAHKTTIEFTRAKDVTPAGDCIVGVEATFDSNELLHEFAYPKVEITIASGKDHFTFHATPNKQFVDDHELVFRKSDFVSERTAGTYASRAACDLPATLRRILQKGGQCTVSVKGLPLQYILFDFDDTLCDFTGARDACHAIIAKQLARRYHVEEAHIHALLDDADIQFPKKASTSNDVSLFDRHKWLEWVFAKIKVPLTHEENNKWVKKYWACMIHHSRPLDGAKPALMALSKKYHLGLLTDADGNKLYKRARITHSGLEPFIEQSALGDELRLVKPHPTFIHTLLRAFKAVPEQCAVVGDKPWSDLLPAKEAGMLTIWMKHGVYAKLVRETPPYVDYVIKEPKELVQLL